MVAPHNAYPMEIKSKVDPVPERRTPTEGVLSAFEKQNNSYSPIPGNSMTSLSSPGSTSRIDYNLRESRSFSGIPAQVMSFPSSSSFDANSTFPRVNSALSSSSEGHPLLAMPASAKAANLAPGCGSPGSGIDLASKTSRKQNNSKQSVTRRRSTGSKPRNKSTTGEQGSEATAHRRQKRLQRNRESARLSRRRRKQYLEILEERVNKLSEELDEGRRAHVADAVDSIQRKREKCLLGTDSWFPDSLFLNISKKLCRTSEEMMICTSFRSEQMKSFFVPPSLKFVMWLTLQSDQYYRGGRAASERLSAARIGERMLTGGNDRATPNQQMWPLLCNEICLSYDQEEKVRSFQKSVLQDHESWVDRHRIFASDKALASANESMQALTLRIGQRESSSATVLSATQNVKFAEWVEKNRARVTQVVALKVSPTVAMDQFHTTKEQHVAANLYILNHRFENILHRIPRAAPLVIGTALRKLAVRPSFESLGAQDEKNPDSFLSREDSFPSSGSLNKNETDMSMDHDEKIPSQITPLQAQEAARPRVDEALSYVMPIIPAIPTSFFASQTMTMMQNPADAFGNCPTSHGGILSIPNTVTSMDQTSAVPYQSQKISHERKSSFLPAHLNVVPEEMWPEEADEFLMDLVDGDWAIGEGIDMDTFEAQ